MSKVVQGFKGFLVIGTFAISILACNPSRGTLPDVNTKTSNVVVGSQEKPTAVLSGIPDGFYTDKLLSISVGGENVVRYRHKLLLSPGDSCAISDGYGDELPANSMLVLDLSPLEDGETSLCVVGIDADGNIQDFFDATTASWFQKVSGPVSPEGFNLKEGEGRLLLDWTPSEGAETDSIQYILFRSEVALETLSIRDGTDLNVGDSVSGAEVVYVGNELSYIDEGVTRGSSYYYFLFSQDEYKFYSVPQNQKILGVGEPLIWLKNDENPEAKGKAILSGSQPNAAGGMDNLYLCRADIYQNGVLAPGQLVPGPNENISAGRCYVVAVDPNNGGISTRAAVQYEVLILRRGTVDQYLEWKNVQFDPNQIQQIPARSVAGGIEGGNTLYICRGEVDGLQRPGKIADGYERCSASAYNGTNATLPTLDIWQVLTFRLLEEPEAI